MPFPFVASMHFSELNDYGHLLIIDLLSVVEDENICMEVFHGCNDPKIEKENKIKSY